MDVLKCMVSNANKSFSARWMESGDGEPSFPARVQANKMQQRGNIFVSTLNFTMNFYFISRRLQKLKIMKKLAILIVFVSAASLASAQEVELGLRAHPVFGWIKPSSDNMGSDGGLTGFSYGLMADFYISDRYTFGTGLEITSTGGKTREPDQEGNTVLSKYRLQYVEVPVTLRLKTDQNGPLVFYGLFGLEGGVNIKARADRTILDLANPDLKTDQSKLDVDDEISAFRLGLAIGGGAIYDLSGNTRLLGGITFNNGFTDVFEGGRKGTASYISLDIGVFF